jgi:hypothetical protein
VDLGEGPVLVKMDMNAETFCKSSFGLFDEKILEIILEAFRYIISN